MDFAGTLTVRHDTFIRQVGDWCRCVARHGFRNILILNSHGGNQGAGTVVLEKFGVRHPECRIAFASWWNIANAALSRIVESGPGGTGHAGELETSLMLLIAPELVDEEAIQPKANISSYDWAEGNLLSSPSASLYRTFKQRTSNGAMGEPASGTPGKGKRVTEAVTGVLKNIIFDMRKGTSL